MPRETAFFHYIGELSGLAGFLGAFELEPVPVTDRHDGHLVHLAGLNLSRAWMLEGIASAAPSGRIAAMAASHRTAGLAALDDLTYAGAHWIGTFAGYLVTGRGLPRPPATVTRRATP